MKRDARIGLAVVLVLGLMVTLLVGRALYKRGATQPTSDPDEVAQGDGSANYSSDPARTPGTETPASPTAVPANVNNPVTPTASAAPTVPNVAEPAAQTPPPSNAALERFVTDEHRNVSTTAHPAEPAHPAIPAANSGVSSSHGTSTAPAGDHNATPSGNTSGGTNGGGLEDHEGNSADASNIPSDGYGYTVAAGDNMWKISAKVYGDGKYTQKIVEANSHTDTQKLKVGSVLRIPIVPHKTILMKLPSFADAQKEASSGGAAVAHNDKDHKKAADAPKDAPVAAVTKTAAPDKSDTFAGTTHKVESGETLGTIAQKYYGSAGPKSVARIVAANKGLDPNKLKVGQEIEIPAKK
jgi:nucleoid-associated protein YgaU